jgi:peptidoglycan-N-acetylglucosamine deacetylase
VRTVGALTGTTLLAGAVGAGGLVAAAHVGPGVLWLRRVRTVCWPALAGLGWPDHVALTFDDGPDPVSTPRFLDLLAERGVRATFFVLGEMLERAPALGAEIAAAGHELAVHGFRHRTLLRRGPRATYDDLARARDAVGAVTGEPPRLVRPPYGVLTGGALVACARLGLTPVLWTAWGRDWTAAATPQTVLATVLRDLRGGGTVLLHDSDCTSAPGSWRAALGALPHLLDVCAERGWRPGPLRDHGARLSRVEGAPGR